MLYQHLPNQVHVLVDLLHSDKKISPDMLHELTEAREKLVFLVENLQERGAEIRHSLAVSNLGICQCISSKDPLQLCNASRSVLRSQGKALRLSCESIRVRAYSTNCCLPILKSSLDL